MSTICLNPASSTMMSSSWPFPVWGIELIGSLPTGKGRVKYVMVVVDYFTKWTEAKPLATITLKKVLDFVVKSIICRYEVPRKIVSDNETQFDTELFTEFCENNGIIKSFSSVAHPQENGQVKAVNKTLKNSIKKRLEEAKGKWPEELPKVLWAYKNNSLNLNMTHPLLLGIRLRSYAAC
ncbi:uncharacterized protein LOC133791531 [Humulus lupulus]|uniref:uncharacterized protein LOC133791531 n=1 Tax=Humulus lupulus TaxID=3486 RepID=UPI002B40233D|nr:uncharacterized protein LOC133791531 [Humulus lupulus]